MTQMEEHNMNHVIHPGHIMAAALQDDVDRAVSQLQEIIGVTIGDVAAQVFSNFDWSEACLTAREMKLREYLHLEETYAYAYRAAS